MSRCRLKTQRVSSSFLSSQQIDEEKKLHDNKMDLTLKVHLCKSTDRTKTISDIRLMKKSGGKTGTFEREK